MNQALETALTELITKSVKGVETAGEFLVTEIPDVVQQLLVWYAAESVLYSLFGLLCLIIMPCLSPKWFKKGIKLDKENPGNPAGFLLCIASVLFGILGIIIGLVNINITWLKIWIAPKIWLIEYAASIVKPISGQ